MAWRAIPGPLSKRKRRLDSLEAAQGAPRDAGRCPGLCNRMDCSPLGSSVHGDSPGKNIGVGCHALLQGFFPTQGSNPGLHCRCLLYCLSQGCCVASMPAWPPEGAPGTSAMPEAPRGSLDTALVGELLLLSSGAGPGTELPGRVGHKFIPMSALTLNRGGTERPVETCP